MNCQEFSNNIDGLARGALLDARTRDAAASHEEACDLCAARLADERALTAGLRALALKMSDAETPARAEAALLSAFRSRAASTAAGAQAAAVSAVPSNLSSSSNSAASSNPSNVVSLSEHSGEKAWSWVKTVAVAALAAAAVALFMLVPPYLSSPVPSKQSASNSQGSPVKAQDNVVTNGAQNETAQVNDGHGARSNEEHGPTASKDYEGASSQPLTPRRGVVRGTNVSYSPSHLNTPNRGALNEASDAREITTEFIPLVQDAGFAQSEGTHLVRVELPRSALSSFGIPVNAEHAGGRVKADVLFGEDGTARAIRFVQERASLSGR